ncbi:MULTISPECIES: hypothetical protein [unclassified Wolbachia]|uniref:hypothetical protein n=1 Tax=unclassified Wolbachia TaxID=2640676 RepID=UPI0030CA14EA
MVLIDVSYSCTNIAIWYIVNDVIPALPFLSSQCLTLGSRLGTKLVNTKALYNVFDGIVRKPVSSTGMTSSVVFKNKCSYSYMPRHWHDIICLSVENVNRKITWHKVPRLVL